jgi:hypothetical protein
LDGDNHSLHFELLGRSALVTNKKSGRVCGPIASTHRAMQPRLVVKRQEDQMIKCTIAKVSAASGGSGLPTLQN